MLFLLCSILQTNFAHSAEITVSGSVPSGYIDGGSPINGVFNINSIAASSGLVGPYSITSATATFLFSDNNDPTTLTRTDSEGLGDKNCILGSSQWGNCQSSPVTAWLRVHDITHTNPREMASVTVGASTGSASSQLLNSNVYDVITQAVGGSIGSTYPLKHTVCSSFNNCHEYLVYDVTFDRYIDYYGSFSLTLSLGAADLADFGIDGLLSYSVFSALGDFQLESATIVASVFQDDSNPGNPDPNNRIPEPTSSSLFVAALISGVAARYKKRKNKIHKLKS